MVYPVPPAFSFTNFHYTKILAHSNTQIAAEISVTPDYLREGGGFRIRFIIDKIFPDGYTRIIIIIIMVWLIWAAFLK